MNNFTLKTIMLLSPLLVLPTLWLMATRYSAVYFSGRWCTKAKVYEPIYLLPGAKNVLSEQVNITVQTTKSQPDKSQNLNKSQPELCSTEGENLVGPLYVNANLIPNMEIVERSLAVPYGGWVKKGGAWKPTHCQALKKVAIIIPYRNRYEQLKLFLRHMHQILKRQLLDYRIFTVEQSGTTLFNRAILFNIGYNESKRFNNYDCYIFHDIDLLPENDKNMYNCIHSPRHMCPSIDKHNYKLLYAIIFGGVEAFSKEQFENINGFSNKFWGWGGEDDDLYKRTRAKGYHISRPPMTIGRYKMVKIHHFAERHKKNATRTRLLLGNSRVRMDKDGLNTLKYNLLQTEEHLLYTNLLVHVAPNMV